MFNIEKHCFYFFLLVLLINGLNSVNATVADGRINNDYVTHKDDIVKHKALQIIEDIFINENPIFKTYNHMIYLSYAHSIKNTRIKHGIINIQYSIPTKLFMNGRTSLDLFGIIGSIDNQNISQFGIGLIHEFVLNFNWFYATVGVGGYIRNISHSQVSADLIGSRFTFGEKIAIGKIIEDRYNIEIFYRHFSNGDLTFINKGYDFVGIGFGYRF